MGCFLDDLRAFGINADQWATAAQDEGKWRRTAEQGAGSPGRGGMAQSGRTRRGTFHGEMNRCRENQGWTTGCSGMPERDGKDQEEDSRLVLVRSLLLTSHKWCELVSSGRCVLFCPVFVSMLSLKPRPFVQSSFDT